MRSDPNTALRVIDIGVGAVVARPGLFDSVPVSGLPLASWRLTRPIPEQRNFAVASGPARALTKNDDTITTSQRLWAPDVQGGGQA